MNYFLSHFLFFLLLFFATFAHRVHAVTIDHYDTPYTGAERMMIVAWDGNQDLQAPARFAASHVKYWHQTSHTGIGSRVAGFVIILGETSEGIWAVWGGAPSDVEEQDNMEAYLVLASFNGGILKNFDLLPNLQMPFENADVVEATILNKLWSLANEKKWPSQQLKPFKLVAHQNGPDTDSKSCLVRIIPSHGKKDLCWNMGRIKVGEGFNYKWFVEKTKKTEKTFNFSVCSFHSNIANTLDFKGGRNTDTWQDTIRTRQKLN